MKLMETQPHNTEHISACGLYCGSCPKFKKQKCPGCAQNTKATWCKTRSCVMKNNFKSCADCSISNLRECKINNNFVAKAFGFVFNTDRIGGLELIRKIGYDAFAKQMHETQRVSIKRT
ncbi:MAG: DUF3795 domain-containing protein [Bacteroidales bacterium]|nr:DUF3795 domain-containing protein [Bacteroidales bacterium]